MRMTTLVMKFGGAAVETPEQFSQIAEIIIKKRLNYSHIIAVVSAMGKTTDDLLALAHKVHFNPPKREADMLISVGERASSALLAMALDLKGQSAISFTGSQSGVITTEDHSEAKIIEVKPHRVIRELEAGKIVIVAGFQGVSRKGEITTLGRGGSDTSAVALAVALSAEKVEFYKDVEGIAEKDPKQFPESKIFPHLTYEEAIKICESGAKVLHPRCLKLARKNHIPLHVLSFKKSDANGTVVKSGHSGEKIKGFEFETE
ncbi:MAG: aspartate kinase [Chlamydiae bacterium]|nr:aspartate kinase [Chlamydiota bacterium]